MAGNVRREVLLRVRRQSTDCIFKLQLLMAADDARVGIAFWENYDYLARPGDAGREYGYGTRTPYASLAALAAYFEAKVGREPVDTESLEDRLAAAMRELVDRGELGDELGLRENRDRVAAWFEEAGAPVTPDTWVWFDSDD
jgi:hypothetical protein